MVQAQYEGHQFELKLVFVSKKGRDDYLILSTTQTKLQPQTIIQLYGRRWQIESYFKASKQYLAMDESQIQSYDGQVSYIAITELAYILLAWQERLNTDDRTLGDLFYSFTNSLPDITFICALVYLISVLKCSGNEFIEDEIDNLCTPSHQTYKISFQECCKTNLGTKSPELIRAPVYFRAFKFQLDH